MEDNSFQRLWWKFSNADSVPMKKAVMRTAAALHIFTVAQVSVLINHFSFPTDRLEALEIVLLRITDLSKNKDNLLTAFEYRLRDYVKAILSEKILDAVATDRHEPLLIRQFSHRGPTDMRLLKRALVRPYYTTNEWEALGGMLNAKRTGFNYDHIYQLLTAAKVDKKRLLETMDDLALGMTCREAVQVLNLLPLKQRLPVMEALGPMLLDAENKWILIDHGFKGASSDMRKRAVSAVSEISVRVPPPAPPAPPAAPAPTRRPAQWYPRSPLVGTVASFRVVFLVDTSNSMDCLFETNQRELIKRIRLVARDLSRVIKEQLAAGTMFNIVAFGKSATRCFPGGMRPNTPENAERACQFLRSMRAEGPTNTLAAFAEAFDEDELEAVYLITDGKPSYTQSYTVAEGRDIALQVHDVTAEIMRLRHSRGPDEQVPVHATAVLTGVHPSDDVKGTLEFCTDIANRTGGLQRCVVHKSFVLFVAEEQTRNKNAALVQPRQPVRRGWKSWAYQATILASFLFMNGMLALGQQLPWNGQTCGDVSAKYPTYLTPHPRAFLWYRFFTAAGAVMVGKLCLPARGGDGILRAFRLFWPLHCVMAGFWPLAFQYESLLVAMLLSAGMLGCSVMLYMALQVGLRADTTLDEALWVHVPVGSLMAWNSYMFMLSAAVYLKSWAWYGWGWQWEWALLLMIMLSAIALALVVKRKEVAFALTTIWVLANITRAHWAFVYEVQQVEGGVDYSYAFQLCTAGVVLASLLTFVSALTVASRFSAWFTRESTSGQRRRHLSLIALQTSNVVSFFVMLAVNGLSVRWGYLIAGMNQAPLNRQTCGAIAWEAGTVRIMPARFVFRIWPVLYALLLPFVFTQALPAETVLPGGRALAERDEALGKVPMLRGTRRERLIVGLCANRLRFSIPLVHRWRLTKYAQDVVQGRVGYVFFASNLLNIVYLVLWQFREYAWSLIVLIALFASLCAIYTKVNAFRTVLSGSERIVLMNEDEEAEVALQKLKGNAALGRAGAAAAAADSSDDEPEEKPAAAGRKGEEGDDEDGGAGGKPKGGVPGKKPKRVENPTTPWERWTVHVPFSLYLGWVSYMLTLHLAFLAKRDGWSGLGMGDSAWAVIVMAFISLVALGVMGKRKDPVFPLPILLALWGVYWDNSVGTCPATAAASMAGQEVLDRGFHRYWNVTDSAGCAAAEGAYVFADGRCRKQLVDVDDPVTCDRLGTRAGGFVKGYSWLDGVCVEDPGTCPYEFGKGSWNQHTPEYVVSSAALIIFCIVAFANLGFAALIFKTRRARKKAVAARWSNMMDLA